MKKRPGLAHLKIYILRQLGYEERCSDNQYEEDEEECHTWSLTDCPDPCLVNIKADSPDSRNHSIHNWNSCL